MEIAESVAPSKVTLKLDFVKPFEAHNVVEFTMKPKGEATPNTEGPRQGDAGRNAGIESFPEPVVQLRWGARSLVRSPERFA